MNSGFDDVQIVAHSLQRSLRAALRGWMSHLRASADAQSALRRAVIELKARLSLLRLRQARRAWAARVGHLRRVMVLQKRYAARLRRGLEGTREHDLRRGVAALARRALEVRSGRGAARLADVAHYRAWVRRGLVGWTRWWRSWSLEGAPLEISSRRVSGRLCKSRLRRGLECWRTQVIWRRSWGDWMARHQRWVEEGGSGGAQRLAGGWPAGFEQRRSSGEYIRELNSVLEREDYWDDPRFRGRIHEHLDRVRVWMDPREDLLEPTSGFSFST
uniref:Uncharacterized protein n=1 Tax=Haptolina ericina TaxID=156174 RepID=A0A7S3B2I5_9EUKA